VLRPPSKPILASSRRSIEVGGGASGSADCVRVKSLSISHTALAWVCCPARVDVVRSTYDSLGPSRSLPIARRRIASLP
jgi:hypothetical protein